MLTLQFVPYSEIENLNSSKRIKKILSLVKEETIVLLEGRLQKEEETELIQKTMEEIDDKFKGIEIGVIYPEVKDTVFWRKIQRRMIRLLLGNREGFTVIGPATIVKEIKRDPDKIQLLTEETKRKKK
ncbi:DUF2073 domain-containing protein [Candidatus Woesearchaeota archaeon]|nr:DUF2073 domain-containing protein [Candidatus Woesearchaeota archaeon]